MSKAFPTLDTQKDTAGRVARTISNCTPKANANEAPEYLPGQIILEKLQAHGLTQDEFAQAIGLSPMEATRLIKGRKRINVDLAFRLDRFLGIDAKEWIVMQSMHDLMNLGPKFRDTIRKEVPTIGQVSRAKKKRSQ